MAWGTRFKAEIYLLKEKYSSISEVAEAIREIDIHLDDIQSKIKMFTAASLSDVIPENWNEQPIDWLNNEINTLFQTYDEITIQYFKLSLYLEYLKENPEHKIEDDYDE